MEFYERCTISSPYVRTQIKSFLSTNLASEDVIDLTSDFQTIKELVADSGIEPDSPWLGVQFLGDDEQPITIPATNDQGKYRETGAIYFHFVDVARLGNGDGLLTRGQVLRDLIRGRRIGSIIIESVTPMNFDAGATLPFEGGYMSGSFLVSYYCDFDI